MVALFSYALKSPKIRRARYLYFFLFTGSREDVEGQRRLTGERGEGFWPGAFPSEVPV